MPTSSSSWQASAFLFSRKLLRWARMGLEVLLAVYITGMVAAAFWLDPSLGGLCSFTVAVGLSLYVPVRLFVTGRWLDLLCVGLAFIEGLSVGHGGPHGHR